MILAEIEKAAEEALESQRSRMPTSESAASGVFSNLDAERVGKAVGIPG
jgi:hypothetical protein